MSFRPWNNEDGKERMPAKFQFMGSNDAVCDAKSNWSVLCERTSFEEIRLGERRGCEVGQYLALTKFRCLGIKVLSTIKEVGKAALAEIRVWANRLCF